MREPLSRRIADAILNVLYVILLGMIFILVLMLFDSLSRGCG